MHLLLRSVYGTRRSKVLYFKLSFASKNGRRILANHFPNERRNLQKIVRHALRRKTNSRTRASTVTIFNHCINVQTIAGSRWKILTVIYTSRPWHVWEQNFNGAKGPQIQPIPLFLLCENKTQQLRRLFQGSSCPTLTGYNIVQTVRKLEKGTTMPIFFCRARTELKWSANRTRNASVIEFIPLESANVVNSRPLDASRLSSRASAAVLS
jgi:hypothetical protein